MAAKIINLEALKLNVGNAAFTAVEQKVTIDGKDIAVTLATEGSTLTVPDYGTFTLTEAGKITFKAAAALAGAEYTFTNNANATVTVADFSSATAGITATATATLKEIIGGTGDDLLTGLNGTAVTLTGGAGNDTIKALDADTVNAGAGNDVVSVTFAGAKVTLGAGADTLNIANVAATVADYNYAQGDKVALTGKFVDAGDVSLSSGGAFSTASGGLKMTTTAENGVYKVAISDSEAKKREYWTAGSGAAAVMDASSYTNAVVMDATAADSASISLGYGDDTVSLSTNANTVKIGKASGTDTFGTEKFGSDDTLVLTGNGALKDFVLSTSTAGDATYAGTTLAGALEANQGQLKISTDNGATSKMVMYASGNAQTLKASTDVDVYIGKKDSDAVIESATDVNFYDTDKYKNITSKIVVTGSGAFIGAKDKKTSIDASAATDAVQIWGGSTDANDIKLNATGKKSDTVWFGTTDGADSVTAGFVGGYGTDGDVLYLYDTADLSKVTFATGTITTGKSTVSIAGASDKINIKLSDGTVKKVAANLVADTLVNAEGADIVIGKAGSNTTVKYGETQTDSVLVNLYDTDKYTDIVNVDTTEAKKGAVVVGAEGLKSVISTGAGENFIWAGSTDANTITLKNGAGTDTVWFTATDGKDTIENFQTAKDTVRLIDVTGAADIANTYGFALEDKQATLTSSANKTNGLTIKGDIVVGAGTINTINLTDAKNQAFKAAVSNQTDMAFATDASLYYSTEANASVTAANTVTGTILACLNNGADGWSEVGSYYFNDNITTFNASQSAAATALIGRADKASTLMGGLTENTMWGGGYGAQNMQGNISAVDTIWFGTTDGQDTFSSGVDKGDTIWMYDVTSIDSVKMVLGTNEETLVIGGSTLNIKKDDGALDGGLTFKTASGAAYTYDTTNKKFVTKA